MLDRQCRHRDLHVREGTQPRGAWHRLLRAAAAEDIEGIPLADGQQLCAVVRPAQVPHALPQRAEGSAQYWQQTRQQPVACLGYVHLASCAHPPWIYRSTRTWGIAQMYEHDARLIRNDTGLGMT